MPVGEILKCRVVAVAGNQASANVRHYRTSVVAGVEPSLTTKLTAIADLIRPLYGPLMHSSATVTFCGLQQVSPLPLGLEIRTTGIFQGGTGTGDPLPRQVSGIITLRTAFAGRGFRGRVYVPFPGETHNTGTAEPSGQYQLDLQLLANALATSVTAGSGANTATMTPVIFRRRPRTSFDLASAVGQPKWATQRRRGAYGQPNKDN